jgi:hypothetical protein
MGTRLHYKGTEREKIDIERRMRKATVVSNAKTIVQPIKNSAKTDSQNTNASQN